MKFKMAATTGLSLTLDTMGKMFQNASSLQPLGQLKPNCPGMIIGRSSVFYAKIFLFLLIFFVTAAIFDGEWSYHYQDITFNGDLPKKTTL
jgi:hypothetical protein